MVERDLVGHIHVFWFDMAGTISIGNDLLGGIETRTRLLYGIRAPAGDDMSRLDYHMVTCQETSDRLAD